MSFRCNHFWIIVTLVALVSGFAAGCSSTEEAGGKATEVTQDGLTTLSLPEVGPADLEGDRLQVLATTSIIGDVVSQVGGEAIELTVLMKPGQDPHSFEPTVGDLTAAAEADVIFVNGWDLEEGLVADLENVARDVPLVPIAAGIAPLAFGGHEEEAGQAQHGADPHTWLDPHLVRQWVENAEQMLADLDPAHAGEYAGNASAYQAELEALIAYYDQKVAQIPADRRKLVTNHDSLGYFAQAYDFEVVGTVVPAASTLAEPSASDLAELLKAMEREGVCTLFAETTANEQLAETVATELGNCESVQVVTLYTGALGPAGSEADNYLDMMRANIDAIVSGLGSYPS
jgi:ABC-type Zn uptake system ZnuABC Zn-binding protein ZnuA